MVVVIVMTAMVVAVVVGSILCSDISGGSGCGCGSFFYIFLYF